MHCLSGFIVCSDTILALQNVEFVCTKHYLRINGFYCAIWRKTPNMLLDIHSVTSDKYINIIINLEVVILTDHQKSLKTLHCQHYWMAKHKKWWQTKWMWFRKLFPYLKIRLKALILILEIGRRTDRKAVREP